MKKRLLSALCAVMLMLSAVPAVSAQTGDTERYMDLLTVLKLLEETHPDADTPVTRGQAAVLLVRLAGGEKRPDTDGWFAGFRDVPAEAQQAVNYAARRGWVSGVSNTVFHADGLLNADAWCTMLLRMLGYSDKNGDFAVSDAAAFAWRVGLTGRQLSGSLTMGDVAETLWDALWFTYRGTETTVLARLLEYGVCPVSAVNALGLLTPELTARQVADRHLSAVFQLSLYKTEAQVLDGVSAANASGFFISEDGLAVTNYHSIEGAIKADATLFNGEVYGVERVIWYDTGMDIAVIRVSRTGQGCKTSAFHCLEVVGTAEIRPGDTVYALGNPLGLGLAVSSGIISATAHKLERYTQPCVVNSADISQGSSGGALLNAYGQVIAVTSGAYTYGNNMYLAVPADPLLSADLTVEGWTLSEVVEREDATVEE